MNIASVLRDSAERFPHQRAIVAPAGRDRLGRAAYTQLTFQQLDRDSDRLARGFQRLGVRPGQRIVLMVRPGLDFISFTFALFKAGAVVVLIDPGMGAAGVFKCLDQVAPDGFAAIPLVHAIRLARRGRFRRARLNVSVGGRGVLIINDRQLRGDAWTPFEMHPSLSTDPAAIIFTSGGTGVPKGVLYEHGMFRAQVDLIREFYDIRPGEIDLPGFPLFALFNAGMGVTTVVPDMNPARPARVDPAKILESVADQGVTQAFGSPAIWNRVGRHCERAQVRLPSVRRVLSAGAPVPVHVIERMRAAFADPAADIHTPYGATEALPVCSISGREIVTETAALSRSGAGTCVGRAFPQVEIRIIEPTDAPLLRLSDARELRRGTIGEIIVRGPSVTREYFQQPQATARAKIADEAGFWHRMGDMGYLDEQGRLWFCGRQAHVVETPAGRLYSIPCEAIFNNHPRVFRSALVGLGPRPNQRPVVVVEPEPGAFPRDAAERRTFLAELHQLAAAHPHTRNLPTILFHPSLPVDVRHNVKILRERLAPWAAKELARRP